LNAENDVDFSQIVEVDPTNRCTKFQRNIQPPKKEKENKKKLTEISSFGKDGFDASGRVGAVKKKEWPFFRMTQRMNEKSFATTYSKKKINKINKII
jgi:hypothetical protein